jgi:hypothetical protein
VPPNVGITSETGNKYNKLIPWSKEGMKEVVLCFLYIKETTLTKKYKAAYYLRTKRYPNLGTIVDSKL